MLRILQMFRTLREILPLLVGVSTIYILALVSWRIDLNLAKWAPICAAVWFAYGTLTGWHRLGKWGLIGVFWGMLSSYNFMLFLLHDPEFEGWGDVYFFCGNNHEYCRCTFHWNALGWWKAFALWNFSISFAFGIQKLSLLLGLGGLLPGEEVVTKDSIISVCWRLVPYWLNNWEQNWGTECSSMLFEVPRFAMELLVILPCVQIIASRLKILASQQIQVVVSEDHVGDLHQDEIAVNLIKRYWEVDPAQKHFLRRLQANARVMLFLVLLLGFAAFNSLWVPLRLEQESLIHHRSQMAIEAGKILEERASMGMEKCGACNVWAELFEDDPGPIDICPSDAEQYIALYRRNYEFYQGCCKKSHSFDWALKKHARELGRMKNYDHRRMIPLIEVTLAMMRLSCEKFFVLLTVYVNYLVFRKPPKAARMLVQVNSTLSTIFQHVVLYTFPAICWIYGAGIIFSSFVSLIFWGGPVTTFYKSVLRAISYVELKGSGVMTQEHVDRMNGMCSICRGDLVPEAALASEDMEQKLVEDGRHENREIGLVCQHAYHESCLIEWAEHCKGQNRKPLCPMCQHPIEFQVRYKFPWSQKQGKKIEHYSRDNLMVRNVTVVEDEEEDFLFGDPHLQNMLEEMPDIPTEVIEDPGQIQRVVDRQELPNHH